jgi:hypothetical protein
LGRQFRDDVHTRKAAAAQTVDGRTNLVLTDADGGRVEYAISSWGLRRTRTPGGGQPLASEPFFLPGMKVLEFKAGAGGSGEVAIVLARVAPRPGDEGVVTGQFEIVAIASRDATNASDP